MRIDTNARDFFPDHPYIHAADKFARVFGSSSLVAIGVVVTDGTIFTPERIQKIRDITRRLDGVGFDSQTEARDALRDELEQKEAEPAAIRAELDRKFPPYPVNHNQIQSITHGSTRVIQIEADGSLTQEVLMKKSPKTQEDADALRERVRQNPPFIFGRLVSRDEKGALITAGFVTDRLSNREVYTAVFEHIQKIKQEFETEDFKVYITGQPTLVGWVIKYAFEILAYVIATTVVIFLLLWLYFRRWHGVVIPAIAGLGTVIWGLGFTGWWGISFDPLILVIPMIITARAVSHTVQMAERFFEDYEVMLPRLGDPKQARIEVATVAMSELVIPGTLGIVTDVAGLLVIMLTTIPQMYNLGLFGAVWVSSIIVTVEILHPILICYMPAPTEHEHFLPGFMLRFTRGVGWATTHPVWKYVIGAVTVVLLVGSTYITLFHSKIGEATPGTPLLWPSHEFNVATDQIATRFGGVDSLVVYSDGDRPNASADAAPIKAMERFERYLKVNTNLGASVSLVPFLRNFWQINHYGDPKWYFVPSHPGTVRAAIFQLQQNGPPGAMRPFLTDDGRESNISFYYPDHKGDTIVRTAHFAEEFIEHNPLGEVSIRLDEDRAKPGAGFFDKQSLLDLWYYMLGPMLPTRGHTLSVGIRQDDGSYEQRPIETPAQADGLPEWLEEFRTGAQEDFVTTRDCHRGGRCLHLAGLPRGLGAERRRRLVGGQGVRHPRGGRRHQRADRGGPQGGRPGAQVPADQLLDARRAVRDGGRQHGHPGRDQRRGRAQPRRQHLADPLRDLRAALAHLSVGGERRDHPAPDHDRDHALARLHGAHEHRPQHQHAAGAVGGRGHRSRLRDLHRGPHPPGVRRHGGHRRSRAPRRAHHRHGGELHRHHDRGRHRALELLEPALPGRDGPAALDPDGDQHAGRDHGGAGLLLDPAAEGGDGAADGRAARGDPDPEGARDRARSARQGPGVIATVTADAVRPEGDRGQVAGPLAGARHLP